MKPYKLLLIIVCVFLFFLLPKLDRCVFTIFTDNSLKSKIYHQQIDSGQVIKCVLGGGGEFDIIYKDKGTNVDTIYVDGYPALIDDIDTVTVLYKDSLNNYLRLNKLKDEQGRRYSRAIDLMILFK